MGTGFAHCMDVMKNSSIRARQRVIAPVRVLVTVLAIWVAMTSIGVQEVRAQGEASATVTASITVVSSLEVVINQPVLSFGEVSAGRSQVQVSRTSSQAGMFTIQGGPGTTVRLQFNEPSGGALSSAASQLNITTDVYGAQTDDPSVATLIDDGDTITLNEEGEYYLYLEGTLQLAESGEVPPDDYTGTFTLVVSYD